MYKYWYIFIEMNVLSFFKFIADKRPEQYGMEETVKLLTGGYTTPVNDESTINTDTLAIDGVFTTNESIPNYPNVKGYKVFNHSLLEDFYYVFDMTDRNSASYFASIYDCRDTDTMIRLVKHKAGLEKITLKRKPEASYLFDDFNDVGLNNGVEEILLDMCQRYLEDLDEEDLDDINGALQEEGYDVEDFKHSLLSNLTGLMEYLDILKKSWSPRKIDILHEYLVDCFGAVAEFQADNENKNFYLQCSESDYNCTIEHVSFKWPLVYVHLIMDDENKNYEPEFRNDYDSLTDAETTLRSGLSNDIIKKYLELYPIE